MGNEYHKHGPFQILTYTGHDGTPVIEVQTWKISENSKGPVCRVYLNEETLFENPPYLGNKDA